MPRLLAYFTGGGPLDDTTRDVEEGRDGPPEWVRLEAAHPDNSELVPDPMNPMAVGPKRVATAVYERTATLRSDGSTVYRFLGFERTDRPKAGPSAALDDDAAFAVACKIEHMTPSQLRELARLLRDHPAARPQDLLLARVAEGLAAKKEREADA